MKIAVVDYHKGNLKSVERGLIAAGGDAFITDDAARIAQADAIVLPGVGAFADASNTMQALGQMDVVRRRIAAGVPFLGICLGMHLLFEEGIEGAPDEDDEVSSHNAAGLAVLPGVVDVLPRTDAEGRIYKVPHVGWNTVVPAPCQSSDLLAAAETPADAGEPARFSSPLLAGIQPGEYFYFTHSFCAPEGPFAVANTTHSTTFPSVVQYGDVTFGVQFHPEKSSDAGQALLRNFVNLVKGA